MDREGKPTPARTMRYRLSILRERGILLPSYIQTNERRIGLGEGILVLQESSGKSDALEELVTEIPLFYWHIPTHGKFDGYLVHMVHDVESQEMVDTIAGAMKDSGFIDDYYFFDIMENEPKCIDFTHYRPEGGWTWDWPAWHRTIREGIKDNADLPFNADRLDTVIECDARDIQILKQLKLNADISTADIAVQVGISIAEVREKLQRLRDESVIRGYKRAYGFVGDLLWFSCFLEMDENPGGILSCFNELPFPGGFLMESNTQFCLRFGFTTADLKGFLEGFKLLRPYLRSYFFQFHLPDRRDSETQDIYAMFDGEKNKWNMPVDDYVAIIQRHARR